ncbi:hypothetical protein LOTGIDRAFT_130418, partial [Lottia gigantea]
SGKILCLIFTYPKNINKSLAVKNTWAKRCDKQLYFSNKTLPNIPTILLNITESRQLLGLKTRLALQYVYDHEIDEFEWFIKADDDAFFIMENLKNYLSAFNPNDKLYFGKKFSKFKGTTYYMSGGAGYVLSKASVKIIVEKCFDAVKFNFQHIEDMAVGACAEKYNFTAPNTTDSMGRERFHSLSPHVYLKKELKPKWLDAYSVNKLKWGYGNLSNETISFHYLSPEDMQLLEFYLYKLNTKQMDQRRNSSKP